MPQIGAVVESPKFSPMFTGRQNLLLLAGSIGEPASRVDEALETVSLRGRDGDRYKSYSLGMKQRLAIAATLLKQPQLLILDEPTNGLDPAGIREIRETIRDLGARGVTVLLSSHILAEVQQVCDSATIIGHGRMLASGRVEELIGTSTTYRVVVADPAAGARLLESAGHGVRVEGPVLVVDTPGPPEAITRTLADGGVYLAELVPVRADLESVFLAADRGVDRSATARTSARRRPSDEAAHRRAHPAALAPRRGHPAGRQRRAARPALGRAGLEHPPGLGRGDPRGQGDGGPERRDERASRSRTASRTRETSGSRRATTPPRRARRSSASARRATRTTSTASRSTSARSARAPAWA